MLKRKHLPVFLVLMLCVFTGINSYATKRYWVGTGSNKNWNVTGNWSATSGGASGASVPASTDSVYFNGSGTGQCSINAAVSVKRFEITAGYTDSVKQNGNTITVGTSGMVLSGGVFKGGSATITNDGIFTLSGCNFISTSSTLTIAGNYSFTSGTFTHNNGTVVFNTTCSIGGSATFYNLTLSTAGANVTYTIGAGTTLTCTNVFRTDGTNTLTMNGGNIIAQGDITANNGHSSISSGGSTTLTISGTGSQLFTGRTTAGLGKLCNITINKASGTLTLKDKISVNGNWKYTQGTIDITTYDSEVLFYNTSSTHRITGNHTLKNVSFEFTAATNALVVPATDTLTVTGDMKIEGSQSGRLDSGVVNIKGNITTAHTHASAGGIATLYITGTGSQLFTGGTIGQSKIGSVKINKASGALVLKNLISVVGNWRYVAGTIDISTYHSTVAFYPGTRTISGNHTLQDVIIYASGGASVNNISSGDTLTVAGEIWLDGSSNATLNTGTVNAKGDITITNTSTGSGAGTSTFNICGTGDQTLAGSGVVNGGQISGVKVNKPSGTLLLDDVISIAGNDWTYYAGTVDPGTSTVIFYSNNNVSCKNGTAHMAFNNVVIGSNTRTLSTDFYVNGNLTINSSTTLNANSKTIYLGGRWSNSGTFTYANSTVVFNGAGSQYLLKNTGTETFYNLQLDKPSGTLYLTKPVTATNAVTFTGGIMATTAINLLSIPDNVTCSAGSDNSYVAGPVKKTGNDAFVFPLGDSVLTLGAYHPLGITAPGSATDAFTAKYYAVNQAYGDTLQTDSLESISNCEYWLLTRNAGSSTVTPSLGWNSSSCNVDNRSNLYVAGWNSSWWTFMRRGAIVDNGTTGMLSAAAGISASSLPLVIGNSSLEIPNNATPTTDAGTNQSICPGGSAALEATGADNYSWYPQAGLNDPGIANPVASPAATTMYYVVGTNGNTSTIDSVTVTVRSSPSLAVASDENKICAGGSVALSATGSGTFLWHPSYGLSDSTSSSPTANPDSTVNYVVTLTDGYGCTASARSGVTVVSVLLFAADTIIIERGDSTYLHAISNTDNLVWTPSTGLTDPASPSPVVSSDSSLTYTVTASLDSGSVQANVLLEVRNRPMAGFNYTFPGLSVTFNTDNTGSSETYAWDFGDSGTSTSKIPTHTYSAAGTYTVCLTVTNELGVAHWCYPVNVE